MTPTRSAGPNTQGDQVAALPAALRAAEASMREFAGALSTDGGRRNRRVGDELPPTKVGVRLRARRAELAGQAREAANHSCNRPRRVLNLGHGMGTVPAEPGEEARSDDDLQ